MAGGKKKWVRVSKSWKARQAKRHKFHNMAKPKNRQPVQFFKRTSYQDSVISVPAFSANNSVAEFSLSQVINSIEFTNLYDAYQIKAVKLQFIPKFTMADQTPNVRMPVIHSVLDYDDGVPLTNINDYVQYESYKMTMGNKIHSRYLVPACELGAEQAGTIVAAAQKKHQWLDCDAPTVAHRGIKYLITGGTVDIRYDIKITWYLAFKQVR